jgi:hypothetical protein
MRTRFTVNDSGVLVDRDGVELGRLVSLTIDTAGEFGKSGQSVGPTGLSLFEKSKEGNEDSPVGPTISNEVAEVWEVYDRLIGKGRRLYVDRTHGSMIRDAIKATGSVAIVKQAVIGLTAQRGRPRPDEPAHCRAQGHRHRNQLPRHGRLARVLRHRRGEGMTATGVDLSGELRELAIAVGELEEQLATAVARAERAEGDVAELRLQVADMEEQRTTQWDDDVWELIGDLKRGLIDKDEFLDRTVGRP